MQLSRIGLYVKDLSCAMSGLGSSSTKFMSSPLMTSYGYFIVDEARPFFALNIERRPFLGLFRGLAYVAAG